VSSCSVRSRDPGRSTRSARRRTPRWWTRRRTRRAHRLRGDAIDGAIEGAVSTSRSKRTRLDHLALSVGCKRPASCAGVGVGAAGRRCGCSQGPCASSESCWPHPRPRRWRPRSGERRLGARASGPSAGRPPRWRRSAEQRGDLRMRRATGASGSRTVRRCWWRSPTGASRVSDPGRIASAASESGRRSSSVIIGLPPRRSVAPGDGRSSPSRRRAHAAGLHGAGRRQWRRSPSH
jgi:hypothetical protein